MGKHDDPWDSGIGNPNIGPGDEHSMNKILEEKFSATPGWWMHKVVSTAHNPGFPDFMGHCYTRKTTVELQCWPAYIENKIITKLPVEADTLVSPSGEALLRSGQRRFFRRLYDMHAVQEHFSPLFKAGITIGVKIGTRSFVIGAPGYYFNILGIPRSVFDAALKDDKAFYRLSGDQTLYLDPRNSFKDLIGEF